jgi:GNAT superfamily N-acetyltransferase
MVMVVRVKTGSPLACPNEVSNFPMARRVARAISDFPLKKHYLNIKNISEISKDEFQFCFDLVVENMSEYHPNWTEKRLEMQENNTFYILNPQGFLSFQFSVDDHYSPKKTRIPVLYLYELQIAASSRGTGLGSRLIAMAESIAKEFGMDKVTLTVEKANTRAISFYKKRGYDHDSTCPTLFGRDVSFIILSKSVL